MPDEAVRDLLLQLILILLLLVAFIVAVQNTADPEQFFLRYYAKDTGTLVDALFAAPGEVTLTYQELHPSHPMLFDFTTQAVLLAPPSASPTNSTRSVRVQYGAVKGTVPLAVTPTLLLEPNIIVMHKAGAEITFNQEAVLCAPARNSLRRIETLLELDTPRYADALRQFPVVQQLEAPKIARNTISLVITEGEPGLVLGAGEHYKEAAGLACLFREQLGADLPVTQTGERYGYIKLELTLPTQKGVDTTTKAVALALDAYTEE